MPHSLWHIFPNPVFLKPLFNSRSIVIIPVPFFPFSHIFYILFKSVSSFPVPPIIWNGFMILLSCPSVCFCPSTSAYLLLSITAYLLLSIYCVSASIHLLSSRELPTLAPPSVVVSTFQSNFVEFLVVDKRCAILILLLLSLLFFKTRQHNRSFTVVGTLCGTEQSTV